MTKYSENRIWPFHMHGAADNAAEMLIAGHEFPYLRSFYVRLSANPDAISIADAERYVADYTQPGAMRAGKMPVLGLGGTASFFLPIAEKMLSEVAENGTVHAVEDSGHWMAEEQPEDLLQRLREWFQETGG